MSFLKRIFQVSRPTTVCFVLLILTIFALVFDSFMSTHRLKTDGPTTVLDKPHMMLMKFGADSLYEQLARGDSLKILGIRRNTYNQTFLVESRSGNRGWIQSDLLSIPQILSEGEQKGDTIRLTGQLHTGNSSHVSGYNATLPDGTETEVRADDFIPAIEGWQDMVLDDNLMTAIGTEAHFISLQGSTLEELEDKIGPSFQIYRNADGSALAQFHAKAFRSSDGKFYQPTYSLNAGGIAEDVRFDFKSDRSAWMLKILPGAGLIFDIPLTGALIKTSVYSMEYDPLHTTGAKRALLYAAAILTMICGFFWMFFTSSSVVLAMGWLLRFPKVFAPFSDKVLKYAMLIVAIACTYYWSVALLGWGMFWPFLLLLFFVSRYCYKLSTCLLCQEPHERCPRCHRLHTIEFSHDELYNTEYKKGSDIRTGRLLGKSHSKYDTWTEVTYLHTNRYGSSYTSTSRENVQTHKLEHATYEMIDYDVTYRIDRYHNHYVCDECFFEEIINGTTCTEVDRKRTGTHTDTFTREV